MNDVEQQKCIKMILKAHQGAPGAELPHGALQHLIRLRPRRQPICGQKGTHSEWDPFRLQSSSAWQPHGALQHLNRLRPCRQPICGREGHHSDSTDNSWQIKSALQHLVRLRPRRQPICGQQGNRSDSKKAVLGSPIACCTTSFGCAHASSQSAGARARLNTLTSRGFGGRDLCNIAFKGSGCANRLDALPQLS